MLDIHNIDRIAQALKVPALTGLDRMPYQSHRDEGQLLRFGAKPITANGN